MRLASLTGFLLLLVASGAASAAESPAKTPLTIYVYDSFFSGSARERLGEEILRSAKAPVEWVVVGDSGQLISRYRLDQRRGKPRAHLLIGVDQSTFGAIESAAVDVADREIPSLAKVEKRLRFSPKFVPFNHGVFALMVDSEKLPRTQWPRRWSDLLKSDLRKKIVLQDPRTSTPGLGFLLGSHRALGEASFRDFWKKLKDQWLTLSPGWSQSYGLFQKGEAPLVWSYTTSQAYHQLDTPPTARYQTIVFEDGNPVQIEGAVIPADAPGGAPARAATLAALEVLLSESIQTQIPRAQWMMPVRSGVALPWIAVSPRIPEPVRTLDVRYSTDEQLKILKDWSAAIR